MRQLLFASTSLLVLSSFAPAVAADLAARPYTKAPVAPVAIYNWSGFYIGANAGGASSRNCWDLTGVGPIAVVPAVAEGCHNATGAIVGGQIGYRWQSANWVFGLEAQGNWADFSGSNVSQVFAGSRNHTNVDAFGLFTGQVGYAVNNVLLYVKGGAAVTSNTYRVNTIGGALAGVTGDDTRWGGTIGAGLEYAFAPNWSVGVEYNHIFLGGNDRNLTGPLGVLPVNVKQDVDMGLVRLNYKFGGPVIGRY